MVAAGLAFALLEALDIDVLIGLLIMPLTKLLSFSAEVFHTESLDPAVWTSALGEGYNHVCREVPALFVGAEFVLFALFALCFLFEADFSRWRREREMRAQGYRQLEVGDDGPTDEGLEELFPRAEAGPDAGDADPPAHDGLEIRGVGLGHGFGERVAVGCQTGGRPAL